MILELYPYLNFDLEMLCFKIAISKIFKFTLPKIWALPMVNSDAPSNGQVLLRVLYVILVLWIFKVMNEVLMFMYSGKSVNLKDMAPDLLPVADRFALAGLKEMAEQVSGATRPPESADKCCSGDAGLLHRGQRLSPAASGRHARRSGPEAGCHGFSGPEFSSRHPGLSILPILPV